MKKIKRNIILLACCITLFSSFVVSATSASNSITNGAATLTGSARMYEMHHDCSIWGRKGN